MKNSIKSIVVLVSICAVVAVLLALTNSITAPIIKQNENAAANDALLEVLPTGEDFVSVDLSTYELPASVKEAYSEKNGGFVFKLETSGYSSGMIIMCGVNPDGTVSGAICLSSGETLGYEKTFGESFTGKGADDVDTVDTISGATKTTGAYRAAVKDALNSAIILGGGSVDIRTEEEILADNLAAALPAADGDFTKLFVVEILEGIDAVYAAENGCGYVYVVGEEFVAIDTMGNVTNSVSDEASGKASAAWGILSTSKTTDIDLSGYADLPANLISAKKTESGNYIIETKGAGFGINGDEWYSPSGKYIVVRVCISPEKKIINTLTVSQAETGGIGSECANEKFYSQFNGRDESNFRDIDTLAGATLTTNGYKNAIRDAFLAYGILSAN